MPTRIFKNLENAICESQEPEEVTSRCHEVNATRSTSASTFLNVLNEGVYVCAVCTVNGEPVCSSFIYLVPSFVQVNLVTVPSAYECIDRVD